MRPVRKNTCGGYTMLELMVVVVIIGLLAGGIIMGRSLIGTAQVQSVIREYDTYSKAIQEFRDKYQALPGDMSNATTFWGTYATCGTYTASIPANTATCNGDANGRIGTSTTAASIGGSSEWWGAWQHLANAELIDGRYTGQRGSGGVNHAIIGNNVPASQFKPGGWTLFFILGAAANANIWIDQWGHVLSFGAQHTTGTTYLPVLTPAEALELDKKIDDGKPGTGTVRAYRAAVLANCTDESGGTQITAFYKVSYTQPGCSLLFLLGF